MVPYLLAFLAATSAGAGPPALTDHPQDPVLAFVGVHVVPMDHGVVLRDQSVLVRNGRIAAMGPRESVEVPPDAVEIPARGRYLMPGLIDMHVHLAGPRQARWLVAHGVTTVRNMWGSERHVEWSRSDDAPDYFGPSVFTSGPVIDGDPPVWEETTVLTDPADAPGLVQEHREAGYSYLKVYTRLSTDVYEALARAGAEAGMPLVGHVPEAVGVEHALRLGQSSIEHLNGYGPALRPRELPPLTGGYARQNLDGWHVLDPERVSELVRLTVEAGTWNCPTLITRERLYMPSERADSLLATPVFQRLEPDLRSEWRERNAQVPPAQAQAAEDGRAQRLAFVKALHDAGARLVVGTDAGNRFVLHGYSVYEELELFVEAGLTPYEALRGATVSAAEFLGAREVFGTVEVGHRADLLLLEGDPMEDLRNLRRPVGVVLRGQWLPAAELSAMLDWQPE